MSRGPKPKTRKNAAPKPKDVAGEITAAPTSPLSPVALEEFWRLVSELDWRGMLDKTDLSIVTDAARLKALLDQLHAQVVDGIPPRGLVAQIGIVESQRRGRMREMALTTAPNRSVVKTIAKDVDKTDPIAGKIKLHG